MSEAKLLPSQGSADDDRDLLRMEAFHEWFARRCAEPKGSRQKKSNYTFRRKLSFDAWVGCEEWILASFSRRMHAAVQLGEIDKGTAGYVCDMLASAAEAEPNKGDQP